MKNWLAIFILCSFLFPVTVQAQCDFDDTSPITIGTVLVDDAYCPSGGQITILDVTGGGGQYVYEITNGPVIRIIQSQNTFSALPSGTYRIRVSGCNGQYKEFNRWVNDRYDDMYLYYWQLATSKVSGFNCGATNDGVYKIVKPAYPGGTAPYHFQISTSLDFSSSPVEPGADSATFSGLNTSTTYYIRITDACNSFVTVNFTTPAAAPVVPLSVPSLTFNRAFFQGGCSGNETLYLNFKDSATGATYNIANAYSDKVFWGNAAEPHMRIKIEDAVSGALYADRNEYLSPFGAQYYWYPDVTNNGESGLAAPGTGFSMYGIPAAAGVMPSAYPNNLFPANAQLKITIFFPGGTNCGSPVPAYSKTFYYNLGTHADPQALITSIQSNCTAATTTYLKVNFNINYFVANMKLIDPAPVYTVLQSTTVSSVTTFSATINYNPLVIGHTYRVVITDTCGRQDSMNVVYSPGGGLVGPPVISDTIRAAFKCPVNPTDAVYTIYIKPLPSGYSIVAASISGYGNVTFPAEPNWNGTSQVGYKLNKLLAPGTYTYTIKWMYNCQIDSITQTVTISPLADPPNYTRDLTLTVINRTAACSQDAYRAIEISGYLRNINTNYSISNVKLTGVPNDYVFPLASISGSNTVDYLNSWLSISTSTVYDSIKLATGYTGIKINAGQDGTYTFSMEIRCPDGTLIETVTKSISVTGLPIVTYTPNLKFATALICDASGSEGRINLLPVGGKRPFHYEYKLATASSYTATTSAGLDSVVVITPAPAPGTIYDIRVVDACGNAATSKVTTGSFTGNFYIYSYPSDCVNNPFSIRVGTSSINGGYYVWKRNGATVAEGFNLSWINLTGVSVDSITVDVNMFDCYTRSVSRTLMYDNPCNIIVLPVNNLKFTGTRISPSNVQLNWKTQNEQHTSHFELEKSTDGTNFRFVTKVNAAYTMFEHSYSYMDADISALLYYRLKIVDADGHFSYSNIARFENKPVVKIAVQAVPNPAHDNISLYITTEKPKAYKVNIINENGQTMKTVSIAANEIAGGKKIDISNFALGNYFVSLIDGWEIVASTKFIKQ